MALIFYLYLGCGDIYVHVCRNGTLAKWRRFHRVERYERTDFLRHLASFGNVRRDILVVAVGFCTSTWEAVEKVVLKYTQFLKYTQKGHIDIDREA